MNVALRPRLGVVQSKLTRLESQGGMFEAGVENAAFLGRGVAADWHLYIEPAEIQNEHVDMSGLTEIQVWFMYQSFLVQRGALQKSKLIKEGSLLRSSMSGQLFVLYGGAKLPITDTHS